MIIGTGTMANGCPSDYNFSLSKTIIDGLRMHCYFVFFIFSGWIVHNICEIGQIQNLEIILECVLKNRKIVPTRR